MKKILAIALALVMGLTAISSLALIDPGTGGTNNFIFEDFKVSTQYVVTTSAGPASILADESKPMSVNQMIYLDIILDFNSKRLTGVSSMQFNVTSEDVSFASFFNGTQAVVHYLDAYSQVRPIMESATTTNATVVPWAAPAVKTNPGANKVTIDVNTGNWASVMSSANQYYARFLMPNLPGTEVSTATGWNPYTTFHIGLAGLVKDGGTKTEGTVNAAMTISSASFGTNVQAMVMQEWYSTSTNMNYVPGVTHSVKTATNFAFTAPGVYTDVMDPIEAGYAQWVDIYGDSGAMYRVFKITWPNNVLASSWPGANEYIVQKISFIAGSTTYFESWAIGFRNVGGTLRTGATLPTDTNGANARFSTLTFYQNMPTTWAPGLTTGDGRINATNIGPNLAIASALGYVRYTDGAPLSAYYQPILDYFGLSLAYNVAAADSMFAAKAGSSSSKTATFSYFGTVVEEPDDDVDIPETGDGSASVMIVLGASAILAAAALAFVMKKARD